MSATELTIMVDAAGPPEGGVFGTPPIVVDDVETCPDCGSDDIHHGYGFGCGGPGLGPYKMCDCGWTYKEVEPHDQE